MAYAGRKVTLDLNPRRRFPCYESSPESNFTFVPNHSSQYTGSLNSRSNNFPYQRPLFSHLVSTLVCSFVLHMLKTDSYCSFQQNCYGRAKASLVIGGTCRVNNGKAGSYSKWSTTTCTAGV